MFSEHSDCPIDFIYSCRISESNFSHCLSKIVSEEAKDSLEGPRMSFGFFDC